MFRALLLGLAVLLAGSQIGIQPGWSAEQTVERIVPTGEQEIQAITPRAEQRVDGVAAVGEQQIAPQEQPTPAAKAASTAGMIVTGVAAAAVALGATAAMLLLL